jgi:hypothetical protein
MASVAHVLQWPPRATLAYSRRVPIPPSMAASLSERKETVEFVRNRLRAVLQDGSEFYPLSARSRERLTADADVDVRHAARLPCTGHNRGETPAARDSVGGRGIPPRAPGRR